MASGEVQLALSVTEPDCGHNVFRTRTTVRRDGDRFIVNGRKAVTSGIELVNGLLVLGRSEINGGGDDRPRFTTLLLEPDSPGIRRRELPMRTAKGSDSGSSSWPTSWRRAMRSSVSRVRGC